MITFMQYHQALAKFIKSKREATKISLNSFAASIDMTSANLSRIENFKIKLTLGQLSKISTGFHQTPAEFLTEFEQTMDEDEIAQMFED